MIVSLQMLVDCGMLVNGDTQIKHMEEMEQKAKEQKLNSVYPVENIQEYFDKQKGKTMWKARYGERKKGSDPMYRCSTRGAVIDKLYAFYFGTPEKTQKKFKVPTVAECFEEWVADREKKHVVEAASIIHYRADWARYFEGRTLTEREISEGKIQLDPCPFLNKLVTEVKKGEVIAFYEGIVGDENITRKTFGNIKTILNGAFAYAENMDGISCIDPSRLDTKAIAKRCRYVDNGQKVFTPEERDKLLGYLETIPQTVYTLAVRLAFCLAIRIGELRALTWDDYDAENKRLNITHQMVMKPGNGKNRTSVDVDHMKSRSNAGKRTYPLSDYAISVIEELRKINGQKKYILNSGGKDPIVPNKFNEHLKMYCREAGVREMSSHKIRFYACSAMYAAGMKEKDIQKFMGHSAVTTTRGYDRRIGKTEMDDEILQKAFGRSGMTDPEDLRKC